MMKVIKVCTFVEATKYAENK